VLVQASASQLGRERDLLLRHQGGGGGGGSSLGLASVRQQQQQQQRAGHPPRLPWPQEVPEPPLRRHRDRGALPKAELHDLRSVSCLRARQLDPSVQCSGADEVDLEKVQLQKEADALPEEGVGNYPNWQDERCRSNGTYFCDPSYKLSKEELGAITADMKAFADEAFVTCGALDAQLTGSKTTRMPFHLAVAVVGDWPQNEGDRSTLQQFTDVLLTQWGLLPAYNGVQHKGSLEAAASPPVVRVAPCPKAVSKASGPTNCPTAAALVVLADRGQAFFSAPSCEFLCHRRGGLEIEATFEATMQRDLGMQAALSAAIAEVGLALKRTYPLSLEEPLITRERRKAAEYKKWQARVWKTDEAWVFYMRLAMVAIAVGTVCIVLGIVAVALSPADPMLRKV